MAVEYTVRVSTTQINLQVLEEIGVEELFESMVGTAVYSIESGFDHLLPPPETLLEYIYGTNTLSVTAP